MDRPSVKNTYIVSLRAALTKGLHVMIIMSIVLMESACKNDMDKVHFFDRQNMPSQAIDTAVIIRSEHGRLQLQMTAPRIESFQSPERKTVYPQGFVLSLYDANNNERAKISAHYGISFDDRKVMEARDSVVIIDYQSGDTSYLSHIVWNQQEHRIYSIDKVRSVNGQRVTLGDSFESDDEFAHPVITHQRGTMIVNE